MIFRSFRIHHPTSIKHLLKHLPARTHSLGVYIILLTSSSFLNAVIQTTHTLHTESRNRSTTIHSNDLRPTTILKSITMAPAPLQTLPTDLMTIIASELTVKDLKSFRQVCHWADSQTLADFAARGYNQIRLRTIRYRVQELLRVFNDSKPLAQAVKALCIVCEAGGYSQARMLSAEQLMSADARGAVVPVTPLPDIIASVSALESLTISGGSSKTLEHELRLSEIDVSSTLTSLYLEHVGITALELIAVLRTFGQNLQSLTLSRVMVSGGQWREVFAVLQSLLPRLETLKLECLGKSVGQTARAYIYPESVYFRNNGSKLNKAFRGEKGVEVANVHRHFAAMKGRQGIEKGLEVIMEYLNGS